MLVQQWVSDELIPQASSGFARFAVVEEKAAEEKVLVLESPQIASLDEILVQAMQGLAGIVTEEAFARMAAVAAETEIEEARTVASPQHVFQRFSYAQETHAVRPPTVQASSYQVQPTYGDGYYEEQIGSYDEAIDAYTDDRQEFFSSNEVLVHKTHYEPVARQVKREDQHNVVPIAQKVSTEEYTLLQSEQCATVAHADREGELYKLFLDDILSLESRKVRVLENGVYATAQAYAGTVFAGLDATLETMGLVPIYERTEDGIVLKEIKGNHSTSYVLALENRLTGKKRVLDTSIDAADYNPFLERIAVFYTEGEQQEHSAWFSDDFTPILGKDGSVVDGGYELLQFTVTAAEAANGSKVTIHGQNERGEGRSHRIAANSQLYVTGKRLTEAGYGAEYQICDFLLKGGKDKITAARILRVTKNGTTLVTNETNTGYLIEGVTGYGRSEAVDAYGRALKSEDVLVHAGETLSLVNTVQGVYDRRKTL